MARIGNEGGMAVSGLNRALALIKSEQLKITYEEALRVVIEENRQTESKAAKAILELPG